jgi:acetyl esterase/lipase
MNRRLKQTCVLMLSSIGCLITIGGATASQAAEPADSVGPKRIVVLDDIAYREGPSQAWRLDLAMPENFGKELRPALVIIHGGGWSAGDKRDRPFRSMLLDYALKGYVVISVNYRLRKEASMPACIEDCKCAVRWLKAHAKEYRVDTKRIVAYGHSAGAHLVLMLGLAGPEAGLEGDGGWNEYDSRVAAVVAGSPPTELPATFGDTVKHSPITYITADALPILLIQGTADRIVRKEVTDKFVEKMKSVGAKDVRYEVIEGGDHGVAYDSFLDRSTNAMTRFFADTIGQ